MEKSAVLILHIFAFLQGTIDKFDALLTIVNFQFLLS